MASRTEFEPVLPPFQVKWLIAFIFNLHTLQLRGSRSLAFEKSSIHSFSRSAQAPAQQEQAGRERD